MTQNVSIQYFPPKAGSRDTDLGGGYVTSGILKTRFSVIKTDKNPNGFFVSLPRNKDANGEYKDIVSTVNKEAADLLTRLVMDAMNGNNNVRENTTNATQSNVPRTTNLVRKTPAPKVPVTTGIPGDDAPW
ncbi:septation protein SpoVG family protein [uncultured Flavobacterium sp.]|uniref:septation protein SpoVG family protein n=1 Tax=uncultured Flavobacterium sp. TaxID=165435 RepID=UPI002598EDD6|nr:septation protein SpoVG family protein [uncultured Flavobacterium sp.]